MDPTEKVPEAPAAQAGQPASARQLAPRVATALESADLAAFADLLDPDVRWGAPGDPSPTCQNRAQVLDWYQAGRQAGVRARVIETTAFADRILVGLELTGNRRAARDGGPTERWQVLTVRAGRVAEIVGFDHRSQAITHAGLDASAAPG
ncbi:MAG TPA: nuclear transport factor 2 family protein [Streptosporangiaceae bacterium]|nr:nuclear transport factor 2 family protein [Streptosporangiaceae bacterium]